MAKVKICGLTRSIDITAAVTLGADYTGFIFYPPSPRFIDPRQAAALIRRTKFPGCARVGVFVNEEPERVRETFHLCRLDVAQLHGDESPGYCRNLGLPHWKALRPRTIKDLERMDDYPDAVILLDRNQRGKYGGTGLPLPAGILAAAARSGRSIVIAGGVSPENITELWRLHPFAVDINSSIEDRPGLKNHDRMRLIFDRLNKIEPGQQKNRTTEKT